MLRQHFVGLDKKVPLHSGNYAAAVNLDNAATTPPFKAVIDKLLSFAPYYSSIHRGTGYKSKLSSELYESARQVVADFVGADLKEQSIIFVANTTEAINLLAELYSECSKESVVLSTSMEHHSNDLPWRKKFYVDYISIEKDGRLSLDDLSRKLCQYSGRVALVCVTGASNVTGYLNPIAEISQLVHTCGAKLLVDGAQLVPHRPVNIGTSIDFLAFSAHKMYAPFGTGVLVGPKNFFSGRMPVHPGGGTVKGVTHSSVIWEDPPMRHEAGTPNIMGVIALTEAIMQLSKIGMKRIDSYEKELSEYALGRLSKIPDLRLYCECKCCDHIGIIPFNIEGMYHADVARILAAERAISVRSGCFCANPYVLKLLNLEDHVEKYIDFYAKNPDLKPGMVRASLGLYNNFDEVDVFVNFIKRLCQNKQYYIKKHLQ